MGHEERRRDHRFAVTLDGTLARGRAAIRVENVGYRGLLVVASGPVIDAKGESADVLHVRRLVVGQLAQILVAVPDVGGVLLHGVPMRVQDSAELGAFEETEGPRSGPVRVRFGVKLLGSVPYWETYVRALHLGPVRRTMLDPHVAREAS